MKSFLARVRRSVAATTKTISSSSSSSSSSGNGSPIEGSAPLKNSGPSKKSVCDNDLQQQRVKWHGGDEQLTLGGDAAAAANCPVMMRLPLELHIMIIAELLLLDEDGGCGGAVDAFLACLQTCRAWRGVWLSEQIWRGLGEEWMPGFGEMLRLEGKEEGEEEKEALTSVAALGDSSCHGQQGRDDDGSGENSGSKSAQARNSKGGAELFYRMLVLRQRRRNGLFCSALHYGMRLAGDQLFQICTALSADQGGVHSIACEEVDSDDDESNEAGSSSRSNAHPAKSLKKAQQQPQSRPRPQPRKPTHFRFMMYSNGRIAWWPQAYAQPYSAVVDDLRTGARRMYDFPQHGREQIGYTAAMSSELLIMGRGCVLHAWHLSQDTLRTATFPVEIERVFVESDRVVAVGREGAVFFWRFGDDWRVVDAEVLAQCFARGRVRASGLVELPPVSPPHRVGLRLCEDGMLLDFILHPVVVDVFFVVTFSTAEQRLQVHEICTEAGGETRRVAVYEPRAEDMSAFRDLGDRHGYLRWEKIDAHGGYCLMMVNGDELCWTWHHDGDDDNAQIAAPCAQPDAPYTVVAVCFNIYTKEFDFVVYHPPWQLAAGSWHIWDKLLYTPNGMSRKNFLIASRQCSASSLGSRALSNGVGTTRTITITTTVEEDNLANRTIPSFTTVEHPQYTQRGSLIEGDDDDDDDSPIFARRAPFTMDLAFRCRVLVDPRKFGADSVARHIAHVIDTFQEHDPTIPPPSSSSSSSPPQNKLEMKARRRQRNALSRQNEPLYPGKQRIVGDEGMLLFVDNQDYTVLGFREGIITGGKAVDRQIGKVASGKAKEVGSMTASVVRMLPWVKNRP